LRGERPALEEGGMVGYGMSDRRTEVREMARVTCI